MRSPLRAAEAGPESYLVDGIEVVVRRSDRRRKTVSARREAGGIVVHLPATLPQRDERSWVERMARRVIAAEQRRRPPTEPDELQRRAIALATQYLDEAVGHQVRASEIRWVTNQNRRWGSCTPKTGVIRLSARLRQMPTHVVDHVIVHELVHLVEFNHTRRFHELVALHPGSERAIGFLEGWQAAQGLADDGSSSPPGEGSCDQGDPID